MNYLCTKGKIILTSLLSPDGCNFCSLGHLRGHRRGKGLKGPLKTRWSTFSDQRIKLLHILGWGWGGRCRGVFGIRRGVACIGIRVDALWHGHRAVRLAFDHFSTFQLFLREKENQILWEECREQIMAWLEILLTSSFSIRIRAASSVWISCSVSCLTSASFFLSSSK